MIALLLNSGRGTRMGAETTEHPKCMIRLDDRDTIISWQVRQLERCGIRDAVVTTGPFAELLRAHLEGLGTGIRFRYVPNPDYAVTNYIYSMYLARKDLDDDLLLLHGDLAFAPSVLDALVASPVSAVAVDSSCPLPDKDFKAEISGGRVRSIGIDRFGPEFVASQPAYKFLRADAARWLTEIARFVERGDRGVYAENAFNAAWRDIPLYPLDVRGSLCSEIDNPDDRDRVRARFAREVRGRDAGRTAGR